MRASGIIAGLFFLSIVGFFVLVYYSWAWSEKFLAPVRVGMSRSQVQGVVGSPPRIRQDAGAETWDYTRSWSRDAKVYFDTNGIVRMVETD